MYDDGLPRYSCCCRCTGRESLLSQCSNGVYNSDCRSHIGDAGLRCNVPDQSSCTNNKPTTVSYHSNVLTRPDKANLTTVLDVV